MALWRIWGTAKLQASYELLRHEVARIDVRTTMMISVHFLPENKLSARQLTRIAKRAEDAVPGVGVSYNHRLRGFMIGSVEHARHIGSSRTTHHRQAR